MDFPFQPFIWILKPPQKKQNGWPHNVGLSTPHHSRNIFLFSANGFFLRGGYLSSCVHLNNLELLTHCELVCSTTKHLQHKGDSQFSNKCHMLNLPPALWLATNLTKSWSFWSKHHMSNFLLFVCTLFNRAIIV